MTITSTGQGTVAQPEGQGFMDTNDGTAPEPVEPEIPLGQRLFDNWALLMVAGLLIMVVIYTGWGMWEILSLPVAELP